MNTKWEEDFKEISTLWVFDKIEWENAKVFIKDQITKAQQEIAEQIIDDIPDVINASNPNGGTPIKLGRGWMTEIKSQLRKKWLGGGE